MAYAYLQLARDHDARRVVEEAAQVSGARRFSGPYALAGDFRALRDRARRLAAGGEGPAHQEQLPVRRRDDVLRALGAAAWAAWARGKHEETLSLMRSAADIEDKSEKHIVTPGGIVPARELLGDMLLELKRRVDALKEFEASQTREPDRFRGLYGAAQAAAQSGDIAKARPGQSAHGAHFVAKQ